MPFDGFGARINDHAPIVTHYPGTLEQPEELSAYCICGEWEWFSQAGAGGSCDTNYWPDYDQHVTDTEETE